jgi:hypothetical protein
MVRQSRLSIGNVCVRIHERPPVRFTAVAQMVLAWEKSPHPRMRTMVRP